MMFTLLERIEENEISVIAELGASWQGPGDVNVRLEELIKAAKEAGAIGIKFQAFTPDTLVSKKRAPDMWEEVQSLALDKEYWPHVVKVGHDLGLLVGASVFHVADIPDLPEDLDFVKIASSHNLNFYLIQEVVGWARERDIPTLISTGFLTMTELNNMIYALISKISYPRMPDDIVLLHCIAAYPPDEETAQLRAGLIPTMYGFHVGFSDHFRNHAVGMLAVALGYRLFERHIRLPDSNSPDNAVADTPDLFGQYVKNLALTLKILGTDKENRVKTDQEEELVALARPGRDGLRPKGEDT